MYLDEDIRLMIKASEGDRNAYAELYRRYFPAVTSFVSGIDSKLQDPEDISQEVFIRVWENKARYIPDSTVKTYLFSIARNIIYEQQRQRLVATNYLGTTVESSNPKTVVQHKELTLVIEEVKSNLSDKQLQALELMFYSNISIGEAAELAGCSNSVFRRRVYDAKKRLLALLGRIQIY